MAIDQNFAGLASGEVVCAQAIVRQVPSIRWDAGKAGIIYVTPFDFKTRTQDMIEQDPEPDSHPDPNTDDGAIRVSKRLKIFDSDLKDVGYSQTCQRCTSGAAWPISESERYSAQQVMSKETL